MDSEPQSEWREHMQASMDRIETMLHRALHGSEPDTAGIYKRLDRVESDVAAAKGVGKWGLGIVGASIGAICIKLFGGGSP